MDVYLLQTVNLMFDSRMRNPISMCLLLYNISLFILTLFMNCNLSSASQYPCRKSFKLGLIVLTLFVLS